MHKISILFFLIIALGCKESTKQKELKELTSLNSSVLTQKTILQNQQKDIEELSESIDKRRNEIRILKNQKDSVVRLNNIHNGIKVFESVENHIEYYNAIDYKVTSNDDYWKRGVYYTSQKASEFLYNVKTSIINNQLRFYFIGVEVPYTGGDLLANIYELDEGKELHVIDTIDLSPGIEVDLTEDFASEYHIREFVLLQLDNLIIKNDKLYYFKIKGFEESYNVKITNKDYYEYSIGSKKRSQKLDRPILSNTIVNFADNIVAINKVKSKLVVNYGEGMGFYNITDWETQRKFIFLDNFTDELPSINFDLISFFKESEDEFYLDKDTGKDVLFGGLSWHNKKNILYFDNSGMTYRCIWQIDFDNNEVTKIVPEHEAIQPHFFETYDKEYVAYVEGNKIMLCEPTSNNN